MLAKPTPDIEAALRLEYDADFGKFVGKVLEDMEQTNPELFDILYKAFEICKDQGWFMMGSQMACFVYRMLERASGGHMPVIEKETLLPVGLEAMQDPKSFVDKY